MIYNRKIGIFITFLLGGALFITMGGLLLNSEPEDGMTVWGSISIIFGVLLLLLLLSLY